MDVERIVDSVVARFIGTKHERDVKRLQPVVEAVNALEPEIKQLADAQFAEQTAELRELAAEAASQQQARPPIGITQATEEEEAPARQR